MPFQQSTAPRHGHRCTMQRHRVDAVCAAQSVPPTHDIDAQHCPVDCVLLVSHGPVYISSHHSLHTQQFYSEYSTNKDLLMSILMATSYSYVQFSPLHSSINVLRANWVFSPISKLSSTDVARSQF